MHFSLVTAAAALLLPSIAVAGSVDGHVAARHHRSRARWISKRNNTSLPTGWALEAACLTDAPAPDRLLAYDTLYMTNLTPSACVTECDGKGFPYAAVQDGHECWCSPTLNNNTKAGVRTDVSNCNMPCSGNTDINCGGYYALTLYSKNADNSTGGYNGTHSSYSHSYTHTVSSSVQPTTTSIVKAGTTSSRPVPTTTLTVSKSTSQAASTSTKASSSPSSTSKFKLVEDISGPNFFDHWNFFTAADPTQGQVDYVDEGTATSSGLAYVANGQAIMKVDSTSWLGSGAPRKSVRVTSNKAYSSGLMLFDIAAMPYGCSVWPAMWTVGGNWPEGGEIDIIEGVNNATKNQYTLHTGTETSCSTSAVPKTAVTTNPLSTTCASSATADAGCAYSDATPSAYGAGFNAAGGAMYALLIDSDAIMIWKFSRSQIPSDITSGSPNPSNANWGTPAAYWPGSNSCSMTNVIGAQNIVFDITLCGGWCSSDYPTSGCPGTCTDQVMDPSNYKNAQWVVNSVKVYQ